MNTEKEVSAKDGDSTSFDSATRITTLKPNGGIIKCATAEEMEIKRQAFHDGGYHIFSANQKEGKKVFTGYKASKELSPGTIREVIFGVYSES